MMTNLRRNEQGRVTAEAARLGRAPFQFCHPSHQLNRDHDFNCVHNFNGDHHRPIRFAFWLPMVVVFAWLVAGINIAPLDSSWPASAAAAEMTDGEASGSPNASAAGAAETHRMWTFERRDDTDFNGQPDQFDRREGVGFPKYVEAGIVAKDPEQTEKWRQLDSALVRGYRQTNQWLTDFAGPDWRLPLPPSVVDWAVDHYYRVELDGGQFQVRTRAIPANSRYQYRLRADVRCRSLVHDRVHVELMFVDGGGNIIASRGLPTISGTRDWTRMEVSRIVVPAETEAMFVRLGVLGSSDGLEDIRGEIGFDNIRVDRYPQLQLATDRPTGIYRPGDRISVSAQAMGIDAASGRIGFVLLDHDDQALADHVADIQPRIAPFDQPSAPSKNYLATRPSRWELPPLGPGFYKIRAAATTGDGVDPLQKIRGGLTAQTTLAVLNPSIDGAPYGVFGWDFDQPINDDLSPKLWANFLVDSGVSWLKYPCWIPPQPQSGVDRLVELLTRAQDAGIVVVGRLDGPPPNEPRSLLSTPDSDVNPWVDSPSRNDDDFNIVGGNAASISIGQSLRGNDQFDGDGQSRNQTFDFVKTPWQSTADAFGQPIDRVDPLQQRRSGIEIQSGLGSGGGRFAIGDQTAKANSPGETQAGSGGRIAEHLREATDWQPTLGGVMARLTLKIRQWQLGRDDDHSFLETGSLKENIAQIARDLQGFGQPLEIAIAWPWMEPVLPAAETSWQAIVRGETPPLSAAELDAALADRPAISVSDANTWLSLQTIDESQYKQRDRVIDLVRRMMKIRGHRVEAAFLKSVDDPRSGVLRSDGRPGILYLPWRTTARIIGNLRDVGSLDLLSETENAVMVGSSRAVLVMWSANPGTESLYLGDDISIIDVWGRQTAVPTSTVNGRTVHQIPVGPMPVFVTGVDPMLLAFRMSVRLSRNQLDSLLGQSQNLDVEFTNPSRGTLIGGLNVEVPQAWQITNNTGGRWEAPATASIRSRQTIVLSNTAKIGEYVVPLHFQIDSQPTKYITVHRKIDIGPKGLIVQSSTRTVGRDDLVVEIEMTNTSNKIQSYDCLLFPPPGRRYQLRFITIPPGETVRRDFIWSGASELDGKTMLLRAVEQDGPGVLNYDVELVR